jgi:predicted transcriptional regulator
MENENNTIKMYNLNEFNHLKYLLNSNVRTKILISLYEGEKSVTTLKNMVKKPSATISQALRLLLNLELIKKEKKIISLSSKGIVVVANIIKLIETWHMFVKEEKFWSAHKVSHIPPELFKKIHLLRECQYVQCDENNINKTLSIFNNLIRKSRKIKIFLPIYSHKHLEIILKAIDNDLLELEIILNKEVLSQILESEFKNDFEYAVEESKIKFHLTKNKNHIFLVTGSNFIFLGLFLKDGFFDDSTIILGQNEDNLEWGKELFNNLKGVEEISTEDNENNYIIQPIFPKKDIKLEGETKISFKNGMLF